MKPQFVLLLFTIIVMSLEAQTPAFPGAEGGGMYTTGGRGGTVYYVNTLEDNTQGNPTTREGSLRWCIDQTGKRTILFKVSGTIMLQSRLKIAKGDVTIAGQSAPGDGICIGNHYVDISANNVIIRYLRFRMGDDAVISGGADALGGRFFRNVIVDHCSMSWSTDECVSFYNCDFFTLQWCVISESLRLSTHDKGPHGYGGIWGGTNASFHHNLMAHHDSRTPRFGAGNGKTIPPHTETVDHRNNVIYNHGNTYGGEGMNINIVNNFYKPGAKSSTGTARGRIISLDKDTKYPEHLRYQIWGQLYVDGNIVDDGKNEVNCSNATRDNWSYGVFNQFASGYGKVSEAAKDSIRQSAAFDIMGELPNGTIIPTSVSTHSANQAFEKVLEYAGASLSRDSHDERIVHETRTGITTFQGLSKYNGWTTGHPDAPDVDWRSKAYPKPGIIDSHWNTKPLDAGDSWSPWPILKSGEAVSDTDRDGIPDGWLEAKGYSGKSATDLNEEGYTYLEVYLNSLVEEIFQEQNRDALSGIQHVNRQSGLRVSYNKELQQLDIRADKRIQRSFVYNVAGVLVSSASSKDKTITHSIGNTFSSGFYLIMVRLEDQSVHTQKVWVR